MLMKNKNSCFFNLDILSYSPKLRIFGNYNYKTTWSTIISILVLIFSFGFTLYSSLQYFNYENPHIYYFKNSIYNKTISFNLNEILLMFKIGDSFPNNKTSYEDIILKAFIYDFDFNSSLAYNSHEIKLEKCELYKNINNKFKNIIKEYENTQKEKLISDYYCFNKEDSEKFSLYYDKNYGYSYLSLFLYNNLNNKLKISPESLRIYLIMENDYVNHENKKSPLIPKYIETFSSNFNNENIETTVFNLDYIEYDSDDGIFFEEIKSHKGIRLNSETQEFFFGDFPNKNILGRIKIKINRSTYDKYRRNYMKIQELLSEIESIINLFFIVGRLLANIIDRKKMNVDLSRVLMNQKTEINKGDFNLYENNISFNKIFGNIDDLKNKNKFKKNYSFDNPKQINLEKLNNQYVQNISDNKVKKIIKNVILKNMDNNLSHELMMKKIHIYHILKSYLCCFKDKKTKLINLCNNIILDELNIDKILSRIFKLEKIYYLLSDQDKAKIHYMHIQELENINEYLNNFQVDTEKENI